MIRTLRPGPAAALALALTLAGCAAPTTRPVAAASQPRLSALGLGAVMGRDARALEAQFGKPALDIREGGARKLQFASAACVLDAYLYPPARGGEALVTHVDARLPDGRDIDRASCVAALGAARQTR